MSAFPDLGRRLARAWARAAVHLLPARCFACGAPLSALQHLGACAACWARLAPAAGPRCDRCGLPLAGAGRCARCVLAPPLFDGTVAAFVYDGQARRFLTRAKSSGRRELLPALGRQLAAAVRSAGLAGRFEAVVTVAASPISRLRRGFDPAREIGREVARLLEVPHDDGRLRRRLGAFRPVKAMGAAERRRALADAFVATREGASRVLLVDDVMTSGATAAACAAALRASGAGWIHVAVWARTPRLGTFDRAPRRHL